MGSACAATEAKQYDLRVRKNVNSCPLLGMMGMVQKQVLYGLVGHVYAY